MFRLRLNTTKCVNFSLFQFTLTRNNGYHSISYRIVILAYILIRKYNHCLALVRLSLSVTVMCNRIEQKIDTMSANIWWSTPPRDCSQLPMLRTFSHLVYDYCQKKKPKKNTNMPARQTHSTQHIKRSPKKGGYQKPEAV